MLSDPDRSAIDLDQRGALPLDTPQLMPTTRSKKALSNSSTDRSMISVSDNQLRIVAEAADRLPAEARGTFLRRVVAEVREGRSFKDSDIERAVRVALLDQPMKQASVSSTDQGGAKRRSDTPTFFRRL